MSEEVKNLTIGVEESQPPADTALAVVNAEDLNKESLILINQLIAESNVEKTKDLTHLFNINQNKKTMVLKN